MKKKVLASAAVTVMTAALMAGSAMAEEYRALAKQMYTLCGGSLSENTESDVTKNKDNKGSAELQNAYDKKDTASQEKQSENPADTVSKEES